MDWFYIPYMLFLYGSAAITFALAILLWRKRSAPGAAPIALLLFAISQCTLGIGLELASADLNTKLFWNKFQYLGIVLIPAAWLIFVLQYTRWEKWLTPRFYALLSIEPFAVVILVWTNDWHHLIWSQVRLAPDSPLSRLRESYTSTFFIHAGYSYLLMLFGMLLLVVTALNSNRSYRRQFLVFVAAGAVPVLANIVDVAGINSPPYFEWTPVSFTLASLVLGWGIRSFWLFDLVPMARGAIIDGMVDGVVVLDLDNRVVDINLAASHALGRQSAQVIGQSAGQVFAGWPDFPLPGRPGWVEPSPTAPEIYTEFALGEGELLRFYELRSSSLMNRQGLLTGRLVVWSDVTERKRAQVALQAGEERYRQSVEKSPIPIFSVNREGAILTWNRACEKAFYYGQEILGQKYHQLLQNIKDKSVLDAMLARVFEQKLSWSDVDTSFCCKDGSVRFMVSRLYTVLDDHGRAEACFFANTDISERMLVEETLRRQLEELTVLNAVATACARAKSEDELIERVTQIIGQTLYTDNFGLLLVDKTAGGLCIHPSYRGLADEYKQELIPLGQGITGQVAVTGVSRRISDVSRHPEYKRVYLSARSELAVPVKIDARILAVINAESSQPEAFRDGDERLLVTLAGQIALSMERLRAEAAGHQRIQELVAITRVSREITSLLDLQKVLDSIVRHAAQLSRSDASGLFTYRPDSRFHLVAAYGVEEAFIQTVVEQGVPQEGSAVGRAVTEGRPVQIPDVLADPSYAVSHLAGLQGIRAILALPMIKGQEVIGGIVLWHRQPRQFTAEEEVFLQALAQQSVNAVENARLFEAEREQRRMAEVLREVGTALTTTLDFDAVLDCLLGQLARLVPYDAASVMLVKAGRAYITRTRGLEQFGEQLVKEVCERCFDISATHNLKQIAATRQPMIIPDISEYPGWLKGGITGYIHSWLGVPVVIQDEVAAFFTLQKVEPDFYRPEHARRLDIFAGQAGLALQNARFFEETRRRLEEVTLLSKVITLTASAVDLPSALNQVCSEVAHFFKSPQAAFALLNPAGTAAEVIAEYQAADHPGVLGLQIPVAGNPSMSYILEHKVPLAISDAQSDPLLASIHEIMRQREVISILLVPILIGDQVAGTLGIDTLERREFNQADVELMKNIASQVSQALDRLQLFTETRRRAVQQEALNAIIAAAVVAPDLPSLLQAVLDLTLQALRLDKGGVWVSGLAAVQDLPLENGQISRPLAAALRLDTPSTVVVDDWQLSDGSHHTDPGLGEITGFGLRACLTVPIGVEGRRIGAMSLLSMLPKKWLAEEIALAETVGRQLGAAVERLNLLAMTQEQARRVQQIMDTVPDGVLLLDAGRRIVLANPAAWASLSVLADGFDPNEPLSRLGGLPVEDLYRIQPETLWRELETKVAPQRFFEVAARPVESMAHQEGLVLVLRDVTKERENQSRIQMQERLATVGQLAAGIAHDFNNIMSAIVVYTDLLGMELQLHPTGRERLGIIQQQVQRASSLIRQILDFSRRSIMEQADLDLLPFIKELDKLLGRVLPENIRLELTYQPGTYMVNADPTRLQQVFMNLALNARDAMPSGGTLHFELQRLSIRPESQPPFPGLAPGDWISIRVADSGAGIPAEVLPFIFDPFFTTKPVGKGTGLGLSQAYGIIQQHGGGIDVRSRPGEGTTFIIYLKALPVPEEAAALPQEPSQEIVGAGETVLIAEDDGAARNALRALLETQNYRVLAASNGVEALGLFEKEPQSIELVVSDVVMPEMGGVALYQALRQRRPQVKMLFVTGHPLSEENQALLQDGQVRWLQKPFSMKEFTGVLKTLLADPA